MADMVVIPDVPKSTFTREMHDLAHQIIIAARAEVGYPVTESIWLEGKQMWAAKPPAPLEVTNQARIIACESLGVPWKWIERKPKPGRDIHN